MRERHYFSVIASRSTLEQDLAWSVKRIADAYARGLGDASRTQWQVSKRRGLARGERQIIAWLTPPGASV